MSIKQISVFVENKPGSMSAMTGVLAENDIDMRALSLAETGDFSKVPEYACKKAKAYCKQVQNLVEMSRKSRN